MFAGVGGLGVAPADQLVFGGLVGGSPQFDAPASQHGIAHRKFLNTAVEYGGRGPVVAVNVRQFTELPEQSAVGRQPERKQLDIGGSVGRQLGPNDRRIVAEVNTEQVVERLCSFRFAATQ